MVWNPCNPSQQLEYMMTCLRFADSTDEVDLQEAQRDHQRFSDALRLHPEEGCLEPSTTNQKHIQDCENRKFKWKNMLAKCVLEIMGIDHDSELDRGFSSFSLARSLFSKSAFYQRCFTRRARERVSCGTKRSLRPASIYLTRFSWNPDF